MTAASPGALVSRLERLEPGAYWQAFRQESLAFKFACVYLMFEYVRPQSIWPVIDVLPFGLLTLAGGVVVVWLSAAERSERTQGSQLGFLFVFLGVAVLSILASQYPDEGFANLSLLVSWLCAYYLISKSVNNPARFIAFYVLFLLFSFKMSQHGFRSWMFSGFQFNREGVTGAPGWFQNSGEVGIQMCIFLPMLLHFMFAGWMKWGNLQRIVMLLVAMTVVGTVIGSSSRGALIGSGAVLLWMLLRSRYKFRGFIAVAAVGLLVALILPPEFYGRLDTMGHDNSSQTRLEYWAFGWEMMKQHPLLGIGYFNWMPVYAEHLLHIGNLRRPEVCHNIFVQAGSELGFTGLILVVVLIVKTFVLNARTRKLLAGSPDGGFLRQLALGLDAGMIGYLVSAQFVTVLYYPYLWIAVAMTVALHNSVSRPLQRTKKAVRSQPAMRPIAR